MESKRRNMFYENKKQETTCNLPPFCDFGYPGYTALVGYSVAGFRSNASDSGVGGCVELVSPEGKSVLVEVAVAGVLIGSRPDLTFLPEELDQGRNCGVIRGLDIDCRSNPLAIDPWTHSVILNPKEVTSEGEDVDKQEDAGSTSLPDLYAVGPLAGDNFVRFIVGGAVATAASIVDRLQLTVGDTAVSSE
ncbi:hypothetical protein AAG570_007389 [Ranatra chinensis]|uniref:Uncharacterized protein n=1 Tax=Ranatra chinensis TaxID=642074 RepID=A0ABD0XVQ2_9HEMI